MNAKQPLETWARSVLRQRVRRLETALDRMDRKAHPEAIHQVRVASRRLRAALRHLGPCFRKNDADRLRTGVARLGRAMGNVRDLDILAENLAPEARRRGSAMAELVESIRARRDQQFQRAVPDARMLRQRLGGLAEKLLR